jgi:hypothetical protein
MFLISTASSANTTGSISDESKKSEYKNVHNDDCMYFYYKTIDLVNLNFL